MLVPPARYLKALFLANHLTEDETLAVLIKNRHNPARLEGRNSRGIMRQLPYAAAHEHTVVFLHSETSRKGFTSECDTARGSIVRACRMRCLRQATLHHWGRSGEMQMRRREP